MDAASPLSDSTLSPPPALAACPRGEHQIPLGLLVCPVCGLALDPPSVDVYFARQRARFPPAAGTTPGGANAGATVGLVLGLVLAFGGIAALAAAWVYPAGFTLTTASAPQIAQIYSQAGYNAALAVGVLVLALLCFLPWVRSR